MCVESEGLTAVSMTRSMCRAKTRYNPLKVNRRFGGICRLHLRCSRLSQARKQYEAGSKYKSFVLFFKS
jgi:hypothetical protein